MQWYHILYLSIYGLLILCYGAIKATHKKNLRAPVKIVLAAMFFAVSVVAVISNFSPLFLTVSIALLFASFGDMFLLSAEKKNFVRGVCAFGISNLLLVAAGIWRFGFIWYFIPIAIACEIVHIFLQIKKVYNFGDSFALMNTYFPIVGISGCIGLSVIIAGIFGAAGLLFGLGTLSFFISDIVLGVFKFACKKWPIDVLNSLFYFSGVMLIAISLWV